MTIEERLENMERALGRMKRRNRWLLGAILLLAGGLIVPAVFETTAFRARAQGAKTAKEIRAKAFVLEDENGKVRAGLSVFRDVPSLKLSDEYGKTRAALTVIKNGPWLALYDEKGQGRAGLGVLKDSPHLTFFDENGNDRFAAGKIATVSPDGKTIEYPESSLILYGPDGKVIWSAIK